MASFSLCCEFQWMKSSEIYKQHRTFFADTMWLKCFAFTWMRKSVAWSKPHTHSNLVLYQNVAFANPIFIIRLPFWNENSFKVFQFSIPNATTCQLVSIEWVWVDLPFSCFIWIESTTVSHLRKRRPLLNQMQNFKVIELSNWFSHCACFRSIASLLGRQKLGSMPHLDSLHETFDCETFH